MSSNQLDSMADLLASVMADNEKAASDQIDDIKPAPAQPVDPGTSANSLADDVDKPIAHEGERAAEHDANLKEYYGEQAAVESPGPVHASDDVPQTAPAANVTPAGNDPETEDADENAPVAEAEPGTAAPALKLSVEDWTEKATELLVDLAVEAKSAKEEGYDKEDDPAPAGEVIEDAPEPKVEDDDDEVKDKAEKDAKKVSGDICHQLADGDEKVAEELRHLVHSELVNAAAYGSKLAIDTADFLAEIKAEKEAKLEGDQKKIDKNSNGKIDSEDFKMLREEKKESMAMPAAMPAAAPVAEAPAEAAMADDPAVIEAALMELAQEMGVSPEELAAMLAEAGQGGAMAGGDAMAAMDGGAGVAEAKAANEDVQQEELAEGLKLAAAKQAVKADALSLIAETVARGRRA